MKRFLMYSLRWQLGGIVIAPVLYLLLEHWEINYVLSMFLMQLFGAIVFYPLDMWIAKQKTKPAEKKLVPVKPVIVIPEPIKIKRQYQIRKEEHPNRNPLYYPMYKDEKGGEFKHFTYVRSGNGTWRGDRTITDYFSKEKEAKEYIEYDKHKDDKPTSSIIKI